MSQSGAAARELAVVVPAKNEADNVAPLVAEIEAALEGVANYELIFVDDGSRDATAARLAEARSGRPRLRVLHHARSCGQSAAIVSGVRAARAPLIATLDGDGQNDPADIPALLWVMRAAPDAARLLVTGRRVRRHDSRLRRISSRVANAVRGALLGDGTPDTGCGLKIFQRDTFLELPSFDHMHRFLPALMIRAGGRVVSVPVRHRPRERGRSNYGTLDRLWVGVIDLLGVVWLQRRAQIAQVTEDEDVR